MSGADSDFSELPEDLMLLVNRLCNQFEQAWRAGERPRAETLVESLNASLDETLDKKLDGESRRAALRELIPLEIECRRTAGETIDVDDYAARFPDLDRPWLDAACGPETTTAPGAVAARGAARADARADADLEKEHRTLGDYQLLNRLGGGGMGTVYKAIHRRMQRIVALKVLRADLNGDPQLIARFQRELQTAARLSHPNVVTAFDARFDQGVHYLITEFVDGEDLDRVVKQYGPLPIEQAVDCVLQAARGLAYAHQQQVIHRDIKPANLLLDRDGVVKVLDLGLARLGAAESNADGVDGPPVDNLTQSGMIIGTAAFMAPEQARSMKYADARSDIYSLGCTLYFLLTGRAVYGGESAVDILLAHASQPIPPLTVDGDGRTIPRGLRELFPRLIAKLPTERFQRMADVVEALERLSRDLANASVDAALADATPDAPRAPPPATQIPPASSFASPSLAGTSTAATWPLGPPPAAASYSSGTPQPITLTPAARSTSSPRTPRRSPIALVGWATVVVVAMLALTSPWWRRPNDESLGQRPAPSPGPANLPPPGVEPRELATPPAGSSSAPPTSPLRGRSALSFNGQDSYVAVPSLLLEPKTPVTIEAIVQVRSARICNLVSWLGPDWIALFQTADGHWGVGRRLGQESRLIQAEARAAIGEWLHLAATVDQGDMQLFIDGRRQATRSIDFPLPETSGGLYLGGVRSDLLPAEQNSRWFDGLIDCVRISRGVRYREPFAAPQTLESDAATLALYSLEAGRGSTASDESGRGHAGSIVNAEWRLGEG